ncbi:MULTISPECIES: hypothetical protein [Vibrio]|uniref:Uncharacterized protein n=1 Tax=Vibrio bivalvicida TaxID=1276888 RepID=A0A177XW53_9VIBR|nr:MULTISPECIES: hypothetical protein [Vibrio]MBD1567488.1 hypothetical protein [Vibrio sp. S12_S33]OAJ92799.1 hypothetical protein APB76_18125 [Vibrio bivalvicida]
MELWVRRYIGFVTIGGGVLGLATVASYFSQQLALEQWTLVFTICAFYVWSSIVGLLVLEGKSSKKVAFQALIIQLIQIPVISLPIITYQVATGLHLDFIYSTHKSFFLSAKFGSKFSLGFFNGGQLIVIGANLAAIFGAIIIAKYVLSSTKR